MNRTTQIDLLFEKYQRFLRPITKEQEKLALSRDEMDCDDFEISIPMTKKMVKRFIRYYNLTCLYEYVDDGATFTRGEEREEYRKDLQKVWNAMARLKDNFYKEMYDRFIHHNVALYDFEDESLGECECDLMTLWADSIQTQVMNTIKTIKKEKEQNDA